MNIVNLYIVLQGTDGTERDAWMNSDEAKVVSAEVSRSRHASPLATHASDLFLPDHLPTTLRLESLVFTTVLCSIVLCSIVCMHACLQIRKKILERERQAAEAAARRAAGPLSDRQIAVLKSELASHMQVGGHLPA